MTIDINEDAGFRRPHDDIRAATVPTDPADRQQYDHAGIDTASGSGRVGA
ncbi:hypothetical protein AB0I54_28405 [Streptomyces sp. NPDC050625]